MSDDSVQQEKDPRSVAQQVRDVAIYFAIGVAFLCGALYEVEHTSGEAWLGVPWSLFVGCTAVIFGLPVGKMRRHWRKSRFWFYAVALLIIHIIVWIAALKIWLDYIETWNFEELSLAAFGELLFIILVLSRASGQTATEVVEREFNP